MSLQSDNSGESIDLDSILTIISDIARKSADANYIFRGEAEHFCKVSSSLYRQYEEIEVEDFSIEAVQQELLGAAKMYTSETEDFEILTQLQHYGGKTNLIDFTTDYLVALFFACEGSPDKDGRVILLRKSESMKPHIKEPRDTNNRVVAQKSIFLQPPSGYVQPDIEVNVPKEVKGAILALLRGAHGISTQSIYKDIFGFIKHQNVHQSAYAEFHRGLTFQRKEEYDEAIVHYSESIRLNPQLFPAYINRGAAYMAKEDRDLGFADLNSAIDLNPKQANAYILRGIARGNSGDIDGAIGDYDMALEISPDSAIAYSNRGYAYGKKGLRGIAIRDHNKSIDLEPENSSHYINRGATYSIEGAHCLAIEDYNKALELDPDNATALYNRGEAWLCLAEWDKARPDLIAARDAGMDIVSSFHNEFESVSYFDRKYSVDIPRDIAEMLGG